MTSTEHLIAQYGQLTVLYDLIRLRAADDVQHPILAYPSSNRDGKGDSSYEYFTGKELDRMVFHALGVLLEDGFKPQRKTSYANRSTPPIVALHTPSDLDMVVTFFALSRLGYTVMMLSPRLSATACVSLLDTVNCSTILYGQTPSIRATMGEILALKSITSLPIRSRNQPAELHRVTLCIRSWFERLGNDSTPDDVAVILHSSGSTGTPKPLFLTHKALMTHPLRGPGLTSFNSLPWYHLHGLSTAFQAMWMRKTAFMWDASMPVTGDGLTAALLNARPESVHAVPYVLQLLVDSKRGVEALKDCKLVTYGGAPCPDELGDQLVSAGVRFGGSFGLTEAGLVAESISRDANDPYWNYMRFFDNIRPYVWMKPLDENSTEAITEHDPDALYECVYLKGHPALTASNSDDPPGSFYSKDVFKPHPSIPNRWKYITRLDDRITLVNGEKVLPLPIEGHIKQHPLVQDAVVVGVNRATPGLLVFQSEKAAAGDSQSEEYLNAIWPVIEEANVRAEKFSQISRDLVAILPYEAFLSSPRTDKGSLIRAQVYKKYAEVIDKIYTKFDEPEDGTLKLDLDQTREHLMRICNEELGLPVPDMDTDLFSLGMDSLKAIHLRRLILRDFHISGKKLGQNVAFETATVSRLAEEIVALQNGADSVHERRENSKEDELALMSDFVSKYSDFRGHAYRGQQREVRKSAVLTGPTGSIGAHTLVELLKDTNIEKVYCLTRRDKPLDCILETLEAKSLNTPELLQQATQKVTALKSNLASPDLGITTNDKGSEILQEMRQTAALIIHTAWPVNFHYPLRTFEEHIKGLHNLIQFSLDVQTPEPAVLMFCSSISTAMGHQDTHIPEKPMEHFTSALNMGYARSKLIGERMVSLARRSVGASAYTLRIGQVSGHSELGRWNDSEAIPLMIRSALTVRALPELDEVCSWLPVDALARTVLEIARSKLSPGSKSISESWLDVGVESLGIDDDCDCESRSESDVQRDIATTVSNREQDGENAQVDGHDNEDDTVYNISNPETFTWSQLLASLRQQGFAFNPVPFRKWLELLRHSEENGEELVNPAVKLIAHYDAMYSGEDGRTSAVHSKIFRTDKAEKDSETLRSGRLGIIEQGILGRYVADWLARWVG